jgi:hypothetical protein
MTQLIIDIGDAPNDGTGDPARDAFNKCNNNFTELYTTGSGAPLNSPAFTGNPTAPTPTAGDNDTSIATTAFVTAAMAVGSPKDAFKAHRNAVSQSITLGSYIKVQCGTEVFDTNSKYDNAANFRWTPAAGHVVLMGSIGIDLTSSFCVAAIYKNGSTFATSGNMQFVAGGIGNAMVFAMDNANGTDFYELFGFANTGSGATVFGGFSTATWFGGHALI